MSHERGFRILKIQKTRFYLHGSSVFAFCYFLLVFCVFGRPFENSSFTCMGAQFWRTRSAILCFLSFLKTQKNTSGGFSGPLGSKTPPHGPKTPPNHDFGTILEVFWTYFARIFGVMLEVFFMKNVVLPAWELIFQKFRRISWFLFCWRAFQK